MQLEAKSELIIIFTSGIILFLIMIGYLLYFFTVYQKKKKKYQSEQLELKKSYEQLILKVQLEVQEQTFQQIGKELHDNVGQLLSTSRMLIGLTERELQNPPDTLLTANATLAQAIHELRTLAKSMDKEWLERFSFLENIQTMIERINAGKMIHAELIQETTLPLNSEQQIILYRTVQEAIQNVIKHADATHMRIEILKEEEGYLITVSDDGKGFDAHTVAGNMGLNNMRHRIALLSGSISYNSIKEKGTTVTIRLPFVQNI